MKFTKSLVLAAGLASIASVGITSSASAGAGVGIGFGCTTAFGYPMCSGSLRGARNSSGTSDYARFSVSTSGTLTFAASHNGASYYCSFTADASSKLNSAAMSSNANVYFNVYILNGTCNGYISNSSEYL